MKKIISKICVLVALCLVLGGFSAPQAFAAAPKEGIARQQFTQTAWHLHLDEFSGDLTANFAPPPEGATRLRLAGTPEGSVHISATYYDDAGFEVSPQTATRMKLVLRCPQPVSGNISITWGLPKRL